MTTPARTLDEQTVSHDEVVLEFDCYRLNVSQRLLTKRHRPVPLTGRTMSILIVLAERMGGLVGRRELDALLWPNAYVSEGTLRVHINALQKALGQTQEGGRFIGNIHRQGYRLAVPVRRCTGEFPVVEVARLSGTLMSLPRRLPEQRLVGRRQCVERIVAGLHERRLMMLTGPGGIGKTAVAREVALQMSEAFPDGVWTVDLTQVESNTLVVGAVAAALGVAPLSPDPLASVLEFLTDRISLLVLDNCEHVLDGAVQLVQVVLRLAQVRVLATGREHLHAEGEGVYRLEPLAVPAAPGPWTREELLSSSAVSLFVARARAVSPVQFSDEQLCVVADLCRRLGGNPLAIEIAAARLDLLGLSGLIAAVEGGYHLTIVGHRTRPARHWTLRATLDWGYRLLSPFEQTLFRRMGVFCGSFDLRAAAEIMAENGVDTGAVFAGLVGLASKSVLAHEQLGGTVRYRLHETCRVYALDKLRECQEWVPTRNRHALLWSHEWVERIYGRLRAGADWGTLLRCHLEDLRSAIHWSFDGGERMAPGAVLRLYSLWLDFMFAEESDTCGSWVHGERGGGMLLEELPRPLRDILHAWCRNSKGLLSCLLLDSRQAEAANEAAERIGRWMLGLEKLFTQQVKVAVEISAAFPFSVERAAPRPDSVLDPLLALAHHYAGAQDEARWHAERAMGLYEGHDPSPGRRSQRVLLQLTLGRTLWLQGLPQSASRLLRAAMVDAQACGDRYLLANCQVVAALLAMVFGYQHDANALTGLVRVQGREPGMELFQLWALCLEGMLAMHEGNVLQPEEAVARPSQECRCIDALGACNEGLMSTGAILRAEQGAGGWLAAEALRIKAERILESGGLEAEREADAALQLALEIARAQGALFWEHRVVMSQARLWQRRGRLEEARAVLIEVRSRFTEGLDTADLVKSQRMLSQLEAALA